jgi:hypothetical protein
VIDAVEQQLADDYEQLNADIAGFNSHRDEAVHTMLDAPLAHDETADDDKEDEAPT